MISCCYNCGKREIGCHGRCSVYKSALEDFRKKKKEWEKNKSPVLKWGDYIGGLDVQHKRRRK